jgi:hypothetical protein
LRFINVDVLRSSHALFQHSVPWLSIARTLVCSKTDLHGYFTITALFPSPTCATLRLPYDVAILPHRCPSIALAHQGTHPTLAVSANNHVHALNSHTLTNRRNTTKELKKNYPFVDWWPCMYCHKFVAYEDLDGDDRSHFRCQTTQCVGKGILQVTCFWQIKERDGPQLDERLEKRLAQIARSIANGQPKPRLEKIDR